MIDSAAIRATPASLGESKKGPDEPADHALGRGRDGVTTNIENLIPQE